MIRRHLYYLQGSCKTFEKKFFLIEYQLKKVSYKKLTMEILTNFTPILKKHFQTKSMLLSEYKKATTEYGDIVSYVCPDFHHFELVWLSIETPF